MGHIRLLSDETASQVAAGEVVERPASIVKELIENSYDAGASSLSVEFSHGGMRFLAVEDDGSGMDHDDALLSIERHATSKICSAADLSGVKSMGFRGEALPSIASVSRFRLLTRMASSDAGTELRVDGGRVVSVRDAGCAPGTRVEIRDLFYNVPARRKFVRGVETESSHIVSVVHGFALAFPPMAVRLIRDGREVLTLPSASDLATRIRDLHGAGFLERLLPFHMEDATGILLDGYIARPGEGRRDRQSQWIIVNGRPVHCMEISQPLREAYAGSLPAGTHPPVVIHATLPPGLVDCNVHPAKKLVRISQPERLRKAIFDGVTEALETFRTPVHSPHQHSFATPKLNRPQPELPTKAHPPLQARPTSPAPHPPAPETETQSPQLKPVDLPPEHQPSPPHQPVPYRMIGRFGTYFFAFEGPEGLVLLDARAARERIAFEQLLKQMEVGTPPSQKLLLPEVKEFPPREHAWIVEHLPELREAGFAIEPFGGLSLKLEAVPALAADRPADELLHEVATALRAAGRLSRGRGMHELLAISVCRTPMDPPAEAQGPALLEALLQCDLPYAGPNGQPTMIQFSFAELERKFGRTGPSTQ
jgi:DNA mismatch repair protein MutL